jgi:hypothetical protein
MHLFFFYPSAIRLFFSQQSCLFWEDSSITFSLILFDNFLLGFRLRKLLMREEGYSETVSAFSSSSRGGVLCLSWILFLQIKLSGFKTELEREKARFACKLEMEYCYRVVEGICEGRREGSDGLPSVFLTDPCFCIDILVTISATYMQAVYDRAEWRRGPSSLLFPPSPPS